MPYRTCYYQRDFNGITLEKKHPCTGIGSRFSSCSALDNSTRFLMAIEVEKTRSFQQFRPLQGPLLAHQFGEVRMQRPNLVYPRHQAVQVLLAPRTPTETEACELFAGFFRWGATIQLYAGTELAFGDGKCAKDGIAMPCKAQLCASEAVIAPGFISLVNLPHGTGNALLDGVLL